MTPFASDLSQLTIKKLAETPKAKFEFWIQEKWSVLPTDPRFLDLTEEQYALLFAHYERLNPPQRTSAARDDDYSEGSAEDPNLNKQKYVDPDFDDEWENLTIPTDEDMESTEWKEVD